MKKKSQSSNLKTVAPKSAWNYARNMMFIFVSIIHFLYTHILWFVKVFVRLSQEPFLMFTSV